MLVVQERYGVKEISVCCQQDRSILLRQVEQVDIVCSLIRCASDVVGCVAMGLEKGVS